MVDKGVPIQLVQVIHNEGLQVREAPFYQVFSILAGVLIYIIGYCVPTLNLLRGHAAFLTTLTELILLRSILPQMHLARGSKWVAWTHLQALRRTGSYCPVGGGFSGHRSESGRFTSPLMAFCFHLHHWPLTPSKFFHSPLSETLYRGTYFLVPEAKSWIKMVLLTRTLSCRKNSSSIILFPKHYSQQPFVFPISYLFWSAHKKTSFRYPHIIHIIIISMPKHQDGSSLTLSGLYFRNFWFTNICWDFFHANIQI